MTLLNLPDEPCNETKTEIDFSACIKNAVEHKINCTIPDMVSGTPVAPKGRGDLPVCTSSEDFWNYTHIYRAMELTSELDIFKYFGCLPKCKEQYYGNEQ